MENQALEAKKWQNQQSRLLSDTKFIPAPYWAPEIKVDSVWIILNW
jgi:hypothetical protein